LVIVSTYGEGEPTDNSREIYEYLFSKRAPLLKQAHFRRSWPGRLQLRILLQNWRRLDRRLEELGATRIHQRVDCDVDFESTAEAWMGSVLMNWLPGWKQNLNRQVYHWPAFTASTSSTYYSRKNPFPAVLLEISC